MRRTRGKGNLQKKAEFLSRRMGIPAADILLVLNLFEGLRIRSVCLCPDCIAAWLEGEGAA